MKITALRCSYVTFNALETERSGSLLEVCCRHLEQCLAPAKGEVVTVSQEAVRGLERRHFEIVVGKKRKPGLGAHRRMAGYFKGVGEIGGNTFEVSKCYQLSDFS